MKTRWVLPVLFVFTVGLIGGCGWRDRWTGKDRIQEQEETIRDLREENRRLEEQVEDLQDRLNALRTRSDTKFQELSRENQELEQRLSEIKEARTRRVGQNVVLTLPSKILFDLAEAELKPEARQSLAEVAEVIGNFPGRPVLVQGHADTLPISSLRHPSNWHLSAARAVSVVRYLVENQGLPPGKFVAAGYGDHHPVAPNTTPTNRQKNRRVEIVFYPPDLEKKPLETVR